MTKPRQQRQLGAIERKRKLFPEKLAEVLRYSPTGEKFEYYVEHYGLPAAMKRLNEIQQSFGRYMLEAKLDSNGDPIEERGTRHRGQQNIIELSQEIDALVNKQLLTSLHSATEYVVQHTKKTISSGVDGSHEHLDDVSKW